jgi:hypothetical protein
MLKGARNSSVIGFGALISTRCADCGACNGVSPGSPTTRDCRAARSLSYLVQTQRVGLPTGIAKGHKFRNFCSRDNTTDR